MKITKRSFLVRGQPWKIKLVQNLRDDDGTPCLGLCDNQRKVISLCLSLEQPQLLEILLHEYIHAVFFELGFEDEDYLSLFEHILINAIAKDFTLSFSFLKQFFPR